TRQKPDEKKTVFRKPRGKVLVMEDEDRVRVGIGRMLGHLGFQVAYAKNGSEAIHLYKQARHTERPFDVVIMDLSVPGGLGGRETLLNLQELDKDVCAIVSSGHFNDPVLKNYREHGFSGIIPKPYRIEDLDRVLQKVLRGREASEANSRVG
ncbi:MAG: response regulator, partial [Calditrichaeota bacterium]